MSRQNTRFSNRIREIDFRLTKCFCIDNIFIGLGGDSAAGQGDVVPLATILAHPSQIYTFTPVTKYYIGTGTYVAGEIIEIQDVGTVQLVNFTGTNPKNVVLTHNSDGSYSTKST